MKTIQKDELYENLSQFLKTKGVELKEGSYTKGVHAGCSLLADAINLSQTGLERAKTGIEKGIDQVRQVIHEKTAPKPPVTCDSAKPAGDGAKSGAQRPKVQSRKAQGAKAKSKKRGAK